VSTLLQLGRQAVPAALQSRCPAQVIAPAWLHVPLPLQSDCGW
jgi:hypothetical protein